MDSERLHRSNGLGKPARNDVSEILQISCCDERKSMVSDPAAYVDADSCYLRFSDPHPGCSGQTLPFNPKLGERVDNGTFERTNIGDDVALPFPEIKNRITHDLSGAVIRHVATTITVMK